MNTKFFFLNFFATESSYKPFSQLHGKKYGTIEPLVGLSYQAVTKSL
jgi:hypothetical protein